MRTGMQNEIWRMDTGLVPRIRVWNEAVHWRADGDDGFPFARYSTPLEYDSLHLVSFEAPRFEVGYFRALCYVGEEVNRSVVTRKRDFYRAICQLTEVATPGDELLRRVNDRVLTLMDQGFSYPAILAAGLYHRNCDHGHGPLDLLNYFILPLQTETDLEGEWRASFAQSVEDAAWFTGANAYEVHCLLAYLREEAATDIRCHGIVRDLCVRRCEHCVVTITGYPVCALDRQRDAVRPGPDTPEGCPFVLEWSVMEQP
jgi:hypothetical protein